MHMEDFSACDMTREEYDGGGDCWRCGGSGWIVTCIDDLCQGSGECMHGDGEEPCPTCNKKRLKDRY